MYRLDVPSKSEYPELLKVWESSVRASHYFLKEGDIEILKEIIKEKGVFDQMSILVARDQTDTIVGIMGVVANSLEMLFVEGESIGRGIGKVLILHAINNLKINRVEVNEQNEKALKFYEYFGFKVISRSEFDDNGKPYPILRMELTNARYI
jgi:putative acetyltransferase